MDMGATALCHAITDEFYDCAVVGAPNFWPELGVESVYLEKTWHAIHFLLTGDARMTLLLSGTRAAFISEQCEVHRAESIGDFYNGLKNRTADELLSGFDPKLFDEFKIYPGSPWADDDGVTYIRPYLSAFLDLLKILTERKLGLMVVIG